MLQRLRQRLTFANVMSSAAVFIALGGTSYALTLPRNSVGARQIRAEPCAPQRSALAPSGPATSRSLARRPRPLYARARVRSADSRGQPGRPDPPAHRALGCHLSQLRSARRRRRSTATLSVPRARHSTTTSSTTVVRWTSASQPRRLLRFPARPPCLRRAALPSLGRASRVLVKTYDAAGTPASLASTSSSPADATP